MDTQKTDEQLMTAYQRGDAQAFEALYGRLAPKLYSYLKKRLQRREIVDECFQMVFAKFHRARNRYDSTYLVEQWLYVICKSTLVDHFRNEARQVAITNGSSVEELSSPTVENATPQLSELSMKTLSAKQRQVVHWRIMDELAYEEIAKRLNESEPNIRQIFSRAVKKLKSILVQEGGSL